MKIDELCEYAKQNGFDSLKFKFTNLLGVEVRGQWTDAWYGFFVLNDEDSFVTVEQWKQITGDIFEFTVIEDGI